jgi:hypothetical protein
MIRGFERTFCSVVVGFFRDNWILNLTFGFLTGYWFCFFGNVKVGRKQLPGNQNWLKPYYLSLNGHFLLPT